MTHRAKLEATPVIAKETVAMKKGHPADNHSGTRQIAPRFLVALAAIAGALTMLAATASAGAPALSVRAGFPDTAPGGAKIFSAGQVFRVPLQIENSGSAPMTGTITITQSFSAGVKLLQLPEGGNCEAGGDTLICHENVEGMLPDGQIVLEPIWELPPISSGEVTSTLEITGGGVADPKVIQKTIQIGPSLPFEVRSFKALVEDENAEEQLQAGSSPDTLANAFATPTTATEAYDVPFPPALIRAVSGHMRNVVVHTPPGVTINFAATDVRCTAAELGRKYPIFGIRLPACPVESQVGVAHVGIDFTVAVYSMVPPRGTPAAFGFMAGDVPVTIYARVRPTDSGADVESRLVSSTLPFSQIEVGLWGVPADSSHDTVRGVCIGFEKGNSKAFEPSGECPTDAPRKAFLRLPTSCNGPLQWGIEIDTYEHPGVYKSRESTTPQQVGCNQLEFAPTYQARPSTNVGDSPSGLELNLHLPQNEDPDGLAEAHLKDLKLQLPDGMTVNSAAADGLDACSPAQIGLLTAAGQLPARFNGEEPRCPDASKLGSVVVNTPAIDHPLPGLIYLASQQQNPFGSLLGLYLVVNDAETGVVVKVPIKAELDEKTGQLSTVVSNGPQVPFEDLEVELDKGAHAALRTPMGCGKFTSASQMTPWSSPEGKSVSLTDSFEVVKGAGGEACVANEAAAPFDPKFSSGMLDPTAGAYSSFALSITRPDGTQALRGIELNLPKGLLASLRGIPYCSDGALNGIPTGLGTGAVELAHPSCPAASQLGIVSASVGAGPSPLTVRTGRAYWTGPYNGAPVGLAVVFPAVAGPFDLGNVITRVGFHVDRETAQITAKADPLPTILHGVPLDIRALRFDLNRPNYTFNPTSCDPMSFQANLSSASGQVVQRSERFQVGGCANLGFKPKLSLRLKGGTTRSKNPALKATLTFPPKRGANIAKASVSLPPSEFLDQSHIGTICTRVQFAAHACPARSVYGHARAYSPILDHYLAGPVYLRSSNHELPDLVADLGGQIEIAVVGRIDTDKRGGIRTTFESVPDAPISKFVLSMKGGKKGLLDNSTNLCRGTHRATALFTAQNGKSLLLRPKLHASCSKGAKKKHQKRGSH